MTVTPVRLDKRSEYRHCNSRGQSERNLELLVQCLVCLVERLSQDRFRGSVGASFYIPFSVVGGGCR